MRKIAILSRWPDYDQKRLDNEDQTIFKTKSAQMDKGDKWWRELEDIKDYVKKQVKKMVESNEER